MVLFCLAGICGQTLVYGLNTWLPQLMVIAKYSLASSLTFLLTVNIGAVVGVLVSSRLADRFGPRPVTATAFASSGIALVLMGTGIMPLPAMYFLVAVVGFGSVGAQILVNGFVATYFSGATRATALGITLGIGRIGAVLAISGGGVLVAASWATSSTSPSGLSQQQSALSQFCPSPGSRQLLPQFPQNQNRRPLRRLPLRLPRTSSSTDPVRQTHQQTT
ncbi:MFS transporter [Arthrobacter sp. SA17]